MCICHFFFASDRFLTDTKIKPSFDNADLLGSNTTIGSATTVNNGIPKIFHGISIFVDGFTIPSHQVCTSLSIGIEFSYDVVCVECY